MLLLAITAGALVPTMAEAAQRPPDGIPTAATARLGSAGSAGRLGARRHGARMRDARGVVARASRAALHAWLAAPAELDVDDSSENLEDSNSDGPQPAAVATLALFAGPASAACTIPTRSDPHPAPFRRGLFRPPRSAARSRI